MDFFFLGIGNRRGEGRQLFLSTNKAAGYFLKESINLRVNNREKRRFQMACFVRRKTESDGKREKSSKSHLRKDDQRDGRLSAFKEIRGKKLRFFVPDVFWVEL